ncbi:hypothetical protein [Aliikangiella maris]|uniref:Uncharacterized protein n=2 Tax=Aliikangiella maris TaxID=3162458 RepID=A0ABV3MJ53_9GAMM
MKRRQFGSGRYNNIDVAIRFLISLILLVTVSCQLEERPSDAVFENSLPIGGIVIQFIPNEGLKNIDQITQTLKKENVKIFNQSLDWYSTESDFPLSKLDGKTAKQLVDIVNCLKVANEQRQQINCFS